MSEAKRPRCPVCGRLFWCDYPAQWVYKREKVFLCSWGCMRKYDERKEAKEMKILTAEEKRTACEAALRGENPAQYLKQLGVSNVYTAWATCRTWARGNLNQDEYEKLPEKPGKEKPKVELVYDESIAEEYRREQAQKEANEKAREEAMTAERSRIEIQGADERDLWQTAAIRNKKMGTFYYDEKYRTIDWRHPAGEEISLPPEDWKWLGDHINEILIALGVEV